MAYLAMRGCGRANGVSARHGEVSRRLFQDLFPRRPEAEIPVTHATNGVHVPSWNSARSDAMWTAAGGKGRWRGDLKGLPRAIAGRSDEELWSLPAASRRDLVSHVRWRLQNQLEEQGVKGDALADAAHTLDPGALTLGFARRFTAYKRPTLLLEDQERLHRLLTDPLRPVQLMIAGKAHRADHEDKRLMGEWIRFASRPDSATPRSFH